jgi:hypothetical protein
MAQFHCRTISGAMTEPDPRSVRFRLSAQSGHFSGKQYDTVRGRGNFDDGYPNDFPSDDSSEGHRSKSFDGFGRSSRGKRAHFNPRRSDPEASTSPSVRGRHYDEGPVSAPTGHGWRPRDERPRARFSSLVGSTDHRFDYQPNRDDENRDKSKQPRGRPTRNYPSRDGSH